MPPSTFDIVVLSSSPPAPTSFQHASPERRVHNRASSPFILSPFASPKKKTGGALKSGFNAATIPETATRGFATARSLVLEGLTGGQEEHNMPAQKQAVPVRKDDLEGNATAEVPKVKKPRAPRTPKTDKDDSAVNTSTTLNAPTARTRKPLAPTTSSHFAKPAPTAANNEADNIAPKEKVVKPRKPRAKKATAVAAAAVPANNELGEEAPKVVKPRRPRAKKITTDEGDAVPGTSGNDVDEIAPKVVKPRKPCAKKNATDDGDVRATNDLDETVPGPKVVKPRKPRVKKTATNDDNTTIAPPKRAKVTKPRVPSKRKSEEVVSAHFQLSGDTVGAEAPRKNTEVDDNVWDVPLSSPKQHKPLELDEAISRRRDWTPPRQTEEEVTVNSATQESTQQASGLERGNFTSLISGYYPQLVTSSTTFTLNTTATDAASTRMTKRRRVEVSSRFHTCRDKGLSQLVDIPGNQAASRQSSPDRGAPKKKARTITDYVTDQYAPKPTTTEPEAITSNFFSSYSGTTTTTVTKVPLNDTTNTNGTKAPRKRSTSKSESDNAGSRPKPKKAATKPKSAATKPKKTATKASAKSTMVAEKLLSPASAVIRMNRQDLLFGTSSQLALDESPTTVRQIQEAMLESERIFEISPIRIGPRLGNIEGKQGHLWNVSSRDEAGELLEKQDVYMAEPDRTQDFPLLMDSANDDEPDSPFVDIDDIGSAPPVIELSSDIPTPPRTTSSIAIIAADKVRDDSSFIDVDDFPPPSNQQADSSFLDIDDFPTSAQLPLRSSPTPELLSIGGTGSPKKRRGRPPKDQSAICRVPASAPVPHPAPTPKPTTPNKKRFFGIEEILDSEDDEALSPTPPRIRKLELSPPLPLVTRSEELVSVFKIPESHLNFATTKTPLFANITSTIRALPPTNNPSKPSWHEKILMYDAIILEDFTAFLNTTLRLRTWKKATLKQAKAWNKHLKDTGEQKLEVIAEKEEVLAVEKELEVWMVQKWCEEMSVCCIVKEKQKGGARKGLY
jgi:hypothetical protein